MASMLYLLALLGVTLASIKNAHCAASANAGPTLTVQFTPHYPKQIPPLSTIYGGIMTSFLNVVDCDYVAVENVQDNPVQEGHFTGRTTIDMLTLYRVGCMTEATVTTRKEERDVQVQETSAPMLTTAAMPSDLEGRLSKRADLEQSTEDQIFSFANRLSSGIDPTNENITVREFRFLKEINTALFALNIVNSGLPLDQMCQYLKDPSIGNHLEDNYINQDQAAAIVCYASVYGLFFGESNEELLADLAGLEYAVQMHAYGAQTLAEICQNLDYRAASMLGISAEEIHDIVCDGKGGTGLNTTTVPLMTGPSSSGTGVPNRPSSSGTAASGTGWSMTAPSASGTAASGGPGATGTHPNPSSSIIFGTGSSMSSAMSAAGTIIPWYSGQMTTTTDTADRTTITASGGSNQQSASASAVFYNPPQLARNRYRRHGRVAE